MTKSERMRDSSVMMSSAMPSEKYSCSGSPLMLVNASTAIDGLSGNGKASPVSLHERPLDDFGVVTATSGRTTNASTGRAMFFRLSAPSSSNARSSRSRTWSRTGRETQMPPGGHSA